MNLSECRTTTERDVVLTYRRHLRRKGASAFSAQASALAEELAGGAVLSPDFIDRFTGGTREIKPNGRLGLTDAGRALLEDMAGIARTPDQWHYWDNLPSGEGIRSGCGIVRGGLRHPQTDPPAGADVCQVCAHVAEYGHKPPVIIEVSTVEREVM